MAAGAALTLPLGASRPLLWFCGIEHARPHLRALILVVISRARRSTLGACRVLFVELVDELLQGVSDVGEGGSAALADLAPHRVPTFPYAPGQPPYSCYSRRCTR